MRLYKEDILELINQGLTQAQIAKQKGIPVRKVTLFCNSQKIRNRNASEILLFTESEEQVVLGSILGDANITTDGRLRESHSTKQLEYLEYKGSMFENIEFNFIKSKTRYDKRTNKFYHSCHLDSRVYQNFKNYRETWYPQGKKVINYNDFLRIEGKALAIWFMDDGCKYNNSILIATDSFDRKDLEFCCTVLKKKFDLNFRISKKNRLYLLRKDYTVFYNLVIPYMHASMLYKLSPI